MVAHAVRLNRDEVRDSLRPAAVLKHFGVAYRASGKELRSRTCPTCGERSADSVCVEATTGTWICHAHGCHGDVLDLVAGYAKLDVRRDFSRVLALAAEISGSAMVGGLDRDRERVLEERRRRAHEDAARHENRRREAVATMPRVWEGLRSRSDVGERYLASRALDPDALRSQGDIVRYSEAGDPVVALRDLETGQVVGVQYRHIRPGDNKLTCHTGSLPAGAALYGRIAALAPDGVDVAVIAEGLADTLAACLTWPGCAVFGAAGAGQLKRVAAAVAPRVAACRGWLLLVVDDDDAGIEGVKGAVIAAEEAGLALADATAGLEGASTIRLVSLGRGADGRFHHDLADAYRAGWRWRWPS